jgi:hypothetical protein
MASAKGGFKQVEFSADLTAASSVVTEITSLLKEGTGIEPIEKTETFADEKERSAGKGYRINVRSSDLTPEVYAAIKAAEEAGTTLDFRFRGLAEGAVIEDCEDAWNESVDADVTSAIDAADKKVGVNSVKLTVAGTASAGDKLATEAIGPLNLTAAKEITAWVKSSVALNAGDVQLLLDDTAACATPLETLNLPAIPINAWTKVNLKLATPANLTAIISVGVKQVVDKGAFVLWLDDLRAVPMNYLVKKILPTIVNDPKAAGAHNAKKISGTNWGEKESDVIELTT